MRLRRGEFPRFDEAERKATYSYEEITDALTRGE
jgi:hypothetical protein